MSTKIEARKSKIHGNGVFAVKPIKKGERIVEYTGPRLTHAEVDDGEAGDVRSGHTFLFTLNDEYVIDADHEPTPAKWINHSCAPNCEAVMEEDEGDDRTKDRIFIEALRDIKTGEELSYNYGITLAEKHTKELKEIWKCLCGAKDCTGTLLQPKNPKKKKKPSKDKKNKADKKAETKGLEAKDSKKDKKGKKKKDKEKSGKSKSSK